MARHAARAALGTLIVLGVTLGFIALVQYLMGYRVGWLQMVEGILLIEFEGWPVVPLVAAANFLLLFASERRRALAQEDGTEPTRRSSGTRTLALLFGIPILGLILFAAALFGMSGSGGSGAGDFYIAIAFLIIVILLCVITAALPYLLVAGALVAGGRAWNRRNTKKHLEVAPLGSVSCLTCGAQIALGGAYCTVCGAPANSESD